MPDTEKSSSDLSDVFSDSKSIFLNDNEASWFYFNKPEYMEQKLGKHITISSTKGIANAKRVEDFPFPTLLININSVNQWYSKWDY